MAAEEPCGECLDGGEVGEIEVVDLDPGYVGECLLRCVRPESWDDDPSPGSGERAGRGETEAGVAARDEGRLSGEVDPGEDVSGRTVGTEPGVGRVAGHAADARC